MQMSKVGISELAASLANKHGLSSKDAEQFTTSIFEVINEGLHDDKIVKIKGLGTFKVMSVSARESVDVNTGERIMIEGRDKISFVPDASMRDLVNQPFIQFETVVINEGVDFSNIDDKYDNTPDNDQEDESLDEDSDAIGIEKENESKIGDTDEHQDENEDVISEENNAPAELPSNDITENITCAEESGVKEETIQKEEIVQEGTIQKEETAVEETAVEETAVEETAVEETVQEETDQKEEIAPEPVPDELEKEESQENETNVSNSEIDKNIKDWELLKTKHDYEKLSAEKDCIETDLNHNRKLVKTLTYVLIAFLVCVIAFGVFIVRQLNQHNMTLSDLFSQKEKVSNGKNVTSSNLKKTKTLNMASNESLTINQPKANDKKEIKNKIIPDKTNKPKEAFDKSQEQTASSASHGESSDFSKKYDDDPRVRTGAYKITGIAQTITVHKGQTLKSISKNYLGSGMECYIQAVNGGAEDVKAGQKIKIPKLQLKHHK